MPTVISTMAPVPRCEPPVDKGFEADREEEVADAVAVEALDVARDTEMGV